MFYDADDNFHVYGGGLPAPNASIDQPRRAFPVENNLWVFAKNNGTWTSSATRIPGSKYAPSHGLYAQAPEYNLAFFLNGIISNGSSERVYPNMMVINTRTRDIRTVSTADISPSTARVGAVFQYLPLLGRKGGLVLFGGATRYNENITTDQWGTMVIYPFPCQVLMLTGGNKDATRHGPRL
jgi:hypothetical protein